MVSISSYPKWAGVEFVGHTSQTHCLQDAGNLEKGLQLSTLIRTILTASRVCQFAFLTTD